MGEVGGERFEHRVQFHGQAPGHPVGVVEFAAEPGERGERGQHLGLAAVLEPGLAHRRAGRLAGRPVGGSAGREQGQRDGVLGVPQHRAEAHAGRLLQALDAVPAVAAGALHAADHRPERDHRGPEQPQPPPAVLPAVVAVAAAARAEEVTENVSPPPRANTPQPGHGATPQTWQAACSTMGRSRDRTPSRPTDPASRWIDVAMVTGTCQYLERLPIPKNVAQDTAPRPVPAGTAKGRPEGRPRRMPLVRTTRAATD